jgi:glucosamine-6-phosphate deaminase
VSPEQGQRPTAGPEIRVVATRAQAWADAADLIGALLERRAGEGRPAVLGLATGASTTGLHAELVRRHFERGLGFAGVRAFALDEYLPMSPDAEQSFAATLRRQLADAVGMDDEALTVPDGRADGEPALAAAAAHERALREVGGVDLQILGIGRNGHLAFNEPGTPLDGLTRPVDLAPTTRADAADRFGGLERVPRRAITSGLGTILRARELVLLAFGAGKADAVAAALQGPVTPDVPASVIQRHGAVTVWLDHDAASRLAR